MSILHLIAPLKMDAPESNQQSIIRVMIYNHWYVILESKELRHKKPLKIKRLIMGDKPIIEYRKYRHEVQSKGGV